MRPRTFTHGTAWLLALATAGLALLVFGAIRGGSSAGPGHADTPGLTFAVYPGVTPRSAKGAARTMAALRTLKPPDTPLVVRLYSGYTGLLPWKDYSPLRREVASFERSGFDIELVLRYAPIADRGSSQDVTAFVALVRWMIGRFGANRRFVSVQVTNEADRTASAQSDGYFNRGNAAWEALVRGVIAAKATARAKHFDQVKIGFNCAGGNPSFWHYLGRHGTQAFRRSLDWIGIDTYPGTLTPLPSRSLRTGVAKAVRSALDSTRRTYMPLAGIPSRVALHVSENGYATTAGHTDAMQVAALKAAVQTVTSLRRADHVTEYDWFELRDAGHTKQHPVDRLGLLNPDYTPKPAFAVYRRLIRDLG